MIENSSGASASGFPWGKFSRKALYSIRYSDAWINVWHGSVRSSKTISSIVRWLHYVENAPPGELMMVGKTERALKTNILDPIYQMVGPDGLSLRAGAGEATLLGRSVKIASAYNEASEGKIRGATLAGAYGDELTLWPLSFWEQLLNRLSVRGAKLFGTTNPDGPFHWLKANYLDREDELDLKGFHFTPHDNPNLDDYFLEALKAAKTGLFYKRDILGEWVMAEGVVYDLFDPDTHVVDILPAPQTFERYVLGIDYGTNNPCAFILLGLSKGVWYAVREYYHDSCATGRQKTDAEYGADVHAFLRGIRPRSIEVDPSASSLQEQLRRGSLGTILDADNEVLEGIQVVSKGLASGTLKIHASCKNLLREFGTYSWDPAASRRGEDKPLKRNDHALDALRYASQRALKGASLAVPFGPTGESYVYSFGS